MAISAGWGVCVLPRCGASGDGARGCLALDIAPQGRTEPDHRQYWGFEGGDESGLLAWLSVAGTRADGGSGGESDRLLVRGTRFPRDADPESDSEYGFAEDFGEPGDAGGCGGRARLCVWTIAGGGLGDYC